VIFRKKKEIKPKYKVEIVDIPTVRYLTEYEFTLVGGAVETYSALQEIRYEEVKFDLVTGKEYYSWEYMSEDQYTFKEYIPYRLEEVKPPVAYPGLYTNYKDFYHFTKDEVDVTIRIKDISMQRIKNIEADTVVLKKAKLSLIEQID
jgi:hypothetical protein